jgi:biotin carboxyl carrier protein
MKKFKLTINGNKYDVDILNVERNFAEIEVNGSLYKVEVDKDLKPTKTPVLVRQKSVPSSDSDKATVKTSSPSSPKGAGTIKSPLPGVILNVYVKEGDTVKQGDKLLTLEAMKMENNIDSDKEGVVKSVKVKQGDSVLEGDTLIEIGS